MFFFDIILKVSIFLYFLGKSITPPPGFDEAASEQDPSLSRSTTLKSPNKLKSMLSIGKKVWLIHGFYLFFFLSFSCDNLC